MLNLAKLSDIASISSFIALIVAIYSLRNKMGVKLTHAYIPKKFPDILAQKTIDIPITNHKDKAVTIRGVFIVIPKIDLKLPIPQFTIEPYGTKIIKFNLHDIYAFKPNLNFSYNEPCSIPTIQVMTGIVGEHFASKTVAEYISLIKSGQFSLEVNTELQRKKVKRKTIKETKRLELSVISKEEAIDNYISNIDDNYINNINKESINLTKVISSSQGNPYSLSIKKGVFQVKKERS